MCLCECVCVCVCVCGQLCYIFMDKTLEMWGWKKQFSSLNLHAFLEFLVKTSSEKSFLYRVREELPL